MTLTTLERRTLLDLIDVDNSRDRRLHELGRTTAAVYADQVQLYDSLRRKLVLETPTDS